LHGKPGSDAVPDSAHDVPNGHDVLPGHADQVPAEAHELYECADVLPGPGNDVRSTSWNGRWRHGDECGEAGDERGEAGHEHCEAVIVAVCDGALVEPLCICLLAGKCSTALF